jgi:streptogrisin C
VDAGIHDWYVDLATNTVVVSALDPSSRAVSDFVKAAGQAVRVVPSAERPRPLYDVRGGDEIILGRSALCSMGFAVQGGYVTAGHCGRTNTVTQGSNWVDSGVVRGSVFPGSDYAWIQTNASWNTLPIVNNYAGGTVPVAGSTQASVGSSVCRSGRTTGWRCGVIQAHNTTINYADGPVYGATRTNACAEGGDSGGSFISGNQAQGVTSGGSGDCKGGASSTFYFPVNPILSAYGLSLKTSGGGGQAIVSRLNNKCLDVPGGNFVDGARLQMWNCNGSAAQQWTFTGGTVRAGGKCMDVAGANPADGTAVQLVGCNGNQAQQFVLNGAGDLVSVLANKCVDIGAWNQNDGAQLVIWPCHGGANQKWFTR